MKIATWNINSVRLREELVLKYFQDHQPDVICLQETKTVNDLFPLAAFRELGFHYAYFEGMKSTRFGHFVFNPVFFNVVPV